MLIRSRKTVFSTPWFQVVAKSVGEKGTSEPYYSLKMSDYVSVVAVTDRQEFILVRQYRPAVEKWTLELPSGHVSDGEKPEQTARRELLEETGYQARSLQCLGSLFPDTGRLSNRMWCYFAPNVRRVSKKKHPEAGTRVVRVNRRVFFKKLRQLEVGDALNTSAILLAILSRKIKIPINQRTQRLK